MTRIIDWNKDMQKDFKKFKESSDNALDLLNNFMNRRVRSSSLANYYWQLNNEELTQFAKDLLDLWTGDAKFPEQKYYVKLLDKEEGYLNCQKSFNDYFVNNNKDDDSDYQTQFTMTEIEAIDPRYKQFAIPVEDE